MEKFNGAFGLRRRSTLSALKLVLEPGELGFLTSDKSIWMRGYDNEFFPLGYGISLLSFGAVEGQDCTDAFLAALDAKGPVLIPAGVWICKETLNLIDSNLIGVAAGLGSAFQTNIIFQELGAKPAIKTRYADTQSKSLTLQNLRIDANSWHPTSGCTGHGLDVEAQLHVKNVIVNAFRLSGAIFHNDASGVGPYNSVLENLSCFKNGNYGILVGTGANNLTFIEPYCLYNGSVASNVAPSAGTVGTVGTVGVTRGPYDGFYIQRDGDGNPGNSYYSYLPESVRVIGGNCSYNGRYGWNLSQVQNSILEPGYAEGNLDTAYQIVVGNSVIDSTVNIAQVQGGSASVNYTNNATNARKTTLWICGRLMGNGANNTNWLLTNLQSILGENADFSKGVYSLWDEASLTHALAAYGGAKIRLGSASTTEFIENNGTINRISSFFIGSGNVKIMTGAGTPESSATAAIGSWYFRNDSSGQVYRKASGTGNTGWILMYGNKDNPTFGDGTAGAFVSVNSGDSQSADFELQNAGVAMWSFRKDSTNVASSDIGCDFELISRTNAGVQIDKPITIGRQAGKPITLARQLAAMASGTGKASLKIPHGVAPTSPADGDVWTTTAGMFVRINGVTKSINLT